MFFKLLLILFVLSFVGACYNAKHPIRFLIFVEVMLLVSCLNFILFSLSSCDIVGQLFSLYVLTISAAEAAIGFSIIVLYFRARSLLQDNRSFTRHKG